MKIKKYNFQEAFPFYIQLILSIGSAKLFMLYLPYLLSYKEISLIGSYEYLISIPLFFISVLTMSTYTNLFKKKLDTMFNYAEYSRIVNSYYKYAFILIIIFSLLQMIYIFTFKVELQPYIYFLLIHDITLVYTAIQGYTLFFWKMNKLIIYISIFVLVVKNTLIYYFVSIYGLMGYFLTITIVEVVIMLYLLLKINRKIIIARGEK
jgi:O-antigen/teichoic acid export membrane protein